MKNNTVSSQENLNLILEHIVGSIQGGQEEIFELSENIHRELKEVEEKIREYRERILFLDADIESLRKEELKKREILYEVSKDFSEYGEEDIKIAYEEANEIHIQSVVRKEEKRSIEKEIELLMEEVSAKEKLIAHAERLMLRIKSVIDFLVTDLTYVGNKLTSLEEQTQIGIRIIKAQEEERRRIARDIHDGPAQGIASLIIKGDIVEKLLRKYPQEAEAELRLMKEHLSEVLREIRLIMYDLRPTMIDDLGLIAAISSMANTMAEEHGVAIKVKDMSTYRVKSSAVALVVYRIIQESLNNAAKHSQARSIFVSIDIQRDVIEGSIVDDGCGFDMSMMEKGKLDSFGLSSMKERAHIIRGKLKIESQKGAGTKIFFSVPNEEDLNEK
ncbi:MAG: sensor histidine kinase [Peptostreptococcaceae bacterium]|nr:sensor histidine kinase [Peptostreptococcaceae bacterium]